MIFISSSQIDRVNALKQSISRSSLRMVPEPASPILTNFDEIEQVTGSLTMEQLNEEKKEREMKSIGLDKILERAMTMLGKCPTSTLFSLIVKFEPEKAMKLSEREKNDMDTLCPLALDTMWRSTNDLAWESFFKLLQRELKDEISRVDRYMEEAILYVNNFPESFIKRLIKKYESSSAVPRKNEVLKGKINYTAAVIAVLLAQNGNDYGVVVEILKKEAASVESKGFGLQN